VVGGDLFYFGKKEKIACNNNYKMKRFGVEKMTAMLKDDSTRKKFVDDSVDFLKKFEFDGLDLDFECNNI
jgi:hypothetical protein